MKKENEELRTHVKLADQMEGDGAAQSFDNPIPSKGKGKVVEEDNQGGPLGEAEVVSKKRRTKHAEPPMPAVFDGKKSLSEFEIWVADMDAYLKFFDEDTWFEFAECRLVGDARTWCVNHQQKMELQGGEPMRTWSELKAMLKTHLVHADETSHHMWELWKLRQTCTIREYVQKFNHLVIQLKMTDEATQLFHFKKGLQSYYSHILDGWKRYRQTTQLEDLFQRLEDAEGTRAQNYSEQPRKIMRPITSGGTSYKPYSTTGNRPKFFGGKPRSQYQHQRTFSGNKGGTRPSGGQRTTTTVNSSAGSNKTGGARLFPTGPKPPVASKTVICFKCSKPGHYARECPHAATIATIVAEETEEMEEVPVGEDTTLEEPGEEMETEATEPEFEEPQVRQLIEHGDYLPWVELNTGGRVCTFLIDTGTDVNVMDEKLVAELKLPRTRIVNPLLVCFVQGSTTVREKLMSVPITIGGITRKHEFLVMKLGEKMDGILSWAWLSASKAKLDIAQGCVTLIDPWGVEATQQLKIREYSKESIPAAKAFQRISIAFQYCSARQFGKAMKEAEEAWMAVVSTDLSQQSEEDRVAQLPIHHDMERLLESTLTSCLRIYLKSYLLDVFVHDCHLVECPVISTHPNSKRSKCSFGQQCVVFLGCLIDEHGIHPNKLKVKAIMEWLQPKSVPKPRSFLGLAGYFRRFIWRFAHKAAALYKLINKRKMFRWGADSEVAFQELKRALGEAPVLKLPKMGEPFELHTDAS
ncbi:hypothetical protein R1sor_010487 [Riccia sorocarpa]|uniref:CCHC-type domain-containing protein n=1 Tax=Riccia sorocarpa TaxID=122646 RepID=A0ABD3HZM2_9MARC